MDSEVKTEFFLTSESVTEGHPDKVCDQISDAILDAYMKQDPMARVACETTVTTGLVLVVGEVTANCTIDMQQVVRDTIREVGYTRAKYGFDADTCAVITSIHAQSTDIAMGVNEAWELKNKAYQDVMYDSIGAGDQGMMFGYASDESKELMPLPITLAHRLVKKLALVRKNRQIPYLRPDGKAQVTVKYVDDKPVAVDTVVVSAQHKPGISQSDIKTDIIEKVVKSVIPAELLTDDTKFLINPTGRFVIGGPHGDSGLTGRKIIVDTYGGAARHGGGAFSGKDCTKVDRSGSYAARYVAKNVVAAGLAKRCEVQVAYAIGVARPVSVVANTFGTGVLPNAEITRLIKECFDLRPAAVISEMELRRPIYRALAAYGHFGRPELDLPWERTDKVEMLRQKAGL